MNRSTTGRWVHPTNRHYASGIHDDNIATDLGLRGGTIAGSAHLDTLVPLLVDHFGNEWFHSGTVSVYFRHATVDGEAVRGTVDFDETTPGIVTVRLETKDGTLVGEGTAGLTLNNAALQVRDLRHDLSNARILSKLSLGTWPERTKVTINGDDILRRCEAGLITEVHESYTRDVVSTQRNVPLSAMVDVANVAASKLLGPSLGEAVGMWGALEVAQQRGPIHPDVEYEASVSIVAISDSPQTELLWHDLSIFDPTHNTPSATLRILSRFLKASSTLWLS